MTFKKTLLATTIAFMSANVSADITDSTFVLAAGDPLVSQQWHLQNTGQSGYSLSSGVAGNDLDIDFSHLMGIKGRGITVSVIDTGVEIAHPDLAANVVPGSINLSDGTDSPIDLNGHGTSVAGLIAAVESNGIGGRGVAPLANLIGFNYLSNQTVASWFVSHGLSEDFRQLDRFTDPRVFNQSYGSTPAVPQALDYVANPFTEVQDLVLQDITQNSHWGRGAVFVKSAGNSFGSYNTYYKGLPIQVLPYEDGVFYNNNGLPFHSSNISAENNNYWNLVVSATNAQGKLSSYSSVGSSVFLTAPGGEYGVNAPAMVTVDLMGCDNGMNQEGEHSNSLHGGSELDPNCDYNGVMNGTSSAAPNTSGAIATIMSANHALDSRTVRHLLATTARKTDADNTGVDLSFEDAAGELVTYNAIPAWQTNAAGYNYHHFYGLGAVDVDAAVYKALFTGVSLPKQQITQWKTTTSNVEIPDASLNGAQSTITNESALIVESVQVKLNIDHSRLRDLAIELVSPSGTRSVLMSARTGFLGGNEGGYTDAVMLNTHFYGEEAKGDWTLNVFDTDKGTSYTLGYNPQIGLIGFNSRNNEIAGVLKDWSIRIFGH
ncbi:S8 family serine peptidase [Pseudoalteromonas denitrificans]|uniref:Regulatory P domain of the subtilisin-like proprotein convertase n=1 Tax=Pseudoalteromonas denitrificans DSM 6059 TaxID=1123010 RepID=A0A1I1M703_9GAMM|nr:S8 family serine peptidase [Pseudoalteromonas denitrificans]SFC79008.1 Regulatory P domain of the subtilisin-like proprotein convertase [Pseudoalteromonas denitrificans DSM 6059]